MTLACNFCKFISNAASSWNSDNAISDEPRFRDHFKTGKQLGSGAYAVVNKCTRKEDGSVYAVKIVKTKNLSDAEEEAIYNEIDILKTINHPHVLQFFHSYVESKYIYIVTELIGGGELFERIVSKKTYSEKETRDTCKILFEAISHCHDHNIVHRDLKPENLLLMSLDNDSDLKIADFGLAKCTDGDSLSTFCGTPSYVAPELVRQRHYGAKADMWSLGCIIYVLLAGFLPFDDDDLKTLFLKIRSGKYSFEDPIWSQVSVEAKDLVSSLLTKNPDKRISAREALRHHWLLEDDDLLKSRNLNLTLENLLKFNASKKFRAAVRAVVTTNRLLNKIDLKNLPSISDEEEEE